MGAFGRDIWRVKNAVIIIIIIIIMTDDTAGID